MTDVVDVLIAGAGAAGLAALDRLSCEPVEARTYLVGSCPITATTFCLSAGGANNYCRGTRQIKPSRLRSPDGLGSTRSSRNSRICAL